MPSRKTSVATPARAPAFHREPQHVSGGSEVSVGSCVPLAVPPSHLMNDVTAS